MARRWYLVLAAVCALYGAGAQGSTIDPADAYLTVPQLITKYKYPMETHHVTTADGYILELHRIPHGRHASERDAQASTPALLVHGLLSSSADFVITGTEKGLGYVLADAGYDVWLGNCRGNYYSRNHTSISPNSASFWDFSFEEMGTRDMPAMIDYILTVTGKRKLHVCGHSQGTTSTTVMLTMLPEYNDKMISVQMFSPVTQLNNIDDPSLTSLASLASLIGNLAALFNMNEILERGAAIEVVDGLGSCNPDYHLEFICSILIDFLNGQVSENLKADKPTLFKHTPAGSAVKQIVHYGQMMDSGRFCRYDHGLIRNLVLYGTRSPPVYDTTKFTAPVYMYYSLEDQLAVKDDVLAMAAALTSTSPKLYEYADMTHFDFAWKPTKDMHNTVIQSMRKNE